MPSIRFAVNAALFRVRKLMYIIQFRDATTQDAEWLYQLNKNSYQDTVVRQFGEWDEPFQRKLFSESWSTRLAKIINLDTKKIGVLSVEQRKEYDWLQEIQLVAKYQNSGIGTQIIKDCINRATQSNRCLRLQVLHMNESAKRLYLRLGFTEIDTLENHYLMEYRDGN